MEHQMRKSKLCVSLMVGIWICFIISIVFLSSCSDPTIEIRGSVVSYNDTDLRKFRLTYFVMNKSDDIAMVTGTVRVRANGDFTIRMKQQKEIPYWLVIEGLDIDADVSVMNNSYEISDNRMTKIDMGDVYIYDRIKVLSDLTEPPSLKDLELQWESNIPNIDFYIVDIVQKVVISGITDNSLSFASIGSILEKQGKHEIDGIVVNNVSGSIEGACAIEIRAVRLINGKAVEIATSGLAVTIIKK